MLPFELDNNSHRCLPRQLFIPGQPATSVPGNLAFLFYYNPRPAGNKRVALFGWFTLEPRQNPPEEFYPVQILYFGLVIDILSSLRGPSLSPLGF